MEQSAKDRSRAVGLETGRWRKVTLSDDDRLLDRAFDLGVEKCLRDARTLGAFPHVTRNGRWLISEHGRWTAGFFVGMLWLVSMVAKDSDAADWASSWAKRLAFRASDRSTHDMGFLFEPSFVRGYRATGHEGFRDVAIQAARSLASRFHAQGRFIPAWSPEEDPSYAALAIVDTIMNVPILIWAGRESGDETLLRVGVETALTIRDQHVREDGATYHVVDHAPKSGAITRKGTHQGAFEGSCWTRGQAWAVYGFTKVGVMLKQAELLETARRLADYFLARLGDAVLPPWDFDRHAKGEPRDSAAGSIAASGLIELGRATGEDAYTKAGRRIAVGLARTCIYFETPDTHGLLRHGSVDVPRRSGIDESIIYGDHYFMEAIMKLRRPAFWEQLGCVEY